MICVLSNNTSHFKSRKNTSTSFIVLSPKVPKGFRVTRGSASRPIVGAPKTTFVGSAGPSVEAKEKFLTTLIIFSLSLSYKEEKWLKSSNTVKSGLLSKGLRSSVNFVSDIKSWSIFFRLEI